jgi:hypothetical protein
VASALVLSGRGGAWGSALRAGLVTARTPDRDGRTLLRAALEGCHGDSGRLRALLDAAHDLSSAERLWCASAVGDAGAVRALLAGTSEAVNAADVRGRAALEFAVTFGFGRGQRHRRRRRACRRARRRWHAAALTPATTVRATRKRTDTKKPTQPPTKDRGRVVRAALARRSKAHVDVSVGRNATSTHADIDVPNAGGSSSCCDPASVT